MRITHPRPDEPIRLIQTKTGHRYRVVIDTAAAGAPRRQISRNFRTIREARDWVTETRDKVAKNAFVAPSHMTINELVAAWLASRRDVRQVTVSGYRWVLNPFCDAYGDRRAQSITRPDIERFMVSLETHGGRSGKALSQRSQSYTLGAIRQTFAYGVSAGVVATNPARDVRARRKRKGDKAPVNVWTPDELVKFRGHCDTDPDDWARVGFRLTCCGLRRSEVLGLAWSEVDIDAGTVHVAASRVRTGHGSDTERDDPKSDASERTVPIEELAPGTVAVLRSLRATQAAQRLAAGSAWESSGLVVADALGRGIHPETYSQRWLKLRRDAGVPKIRMHEVRHTLALTMHRAGVAPADAAALLGHTVGTHLQFYVPRTEQGATRAAKTLGSALRESR
jgi:integrase